MTAEPTGLEHATPVKITSTSATERGGFRKCRRQWLLTVVHRLDPQEGNVHLFLGTIYHAGLEAYYRALKDGASGYDADIAALDAFQEAYDRDIKVIEAQLGFLWQYGLPAFREMAELGMEMLQNYLERERLDPLLDDIYAVEFRVNVPIRSPKNRKVGILSVQADVVGMKDGVLTVVDHKTASREMPSAHLDLDDQLTAEVFSWWLHSGDMPEQAIYNVSYKKAAGPPRTLEKPDKLGRPKLSKSKDQGTTYALYRAEIDRLGLDHADYGDILATLKAIEISGENPLFRRETVFRTPEQMEAFKRDLFHEWNDMRRVAAHPEQAYPNPTPDNCSRCDVRIICTTIQDDGDVGTIIRSGFVVGDPRR